MAIASWSRVFYLWKENYVKYMNAQTNALQLVRVSRIYVWWKDGYYLPVFDQQNIMNMIYELCVN